MIDRLQGRNGQCGTTGRDGLIVAVVVLVFLPGIIAQLKRHPDRRLIWVGCVLLSWTFTGWIALAAWAITGVQSQRITAWIA